MACTYDETQSPLHYLTMCREEAASVRMLANLLFHSPCALCITDATQVGSSFCDKRTSVDSGSSVMFTCGVMLADD